MTSLLARLNAGLTDATALAAAVRDGTLSAAAVLERAREASVRTEKAFITGNWAAAAEAAAALDARRARGERLGPLAGVPISVKDVIAVAGLPATAGATAFAGNIATVTAPAVRRLLAADAVLVGKTNCPEFAFGVTCESPLLGATGNPRYPEVAPGGSSGGEAAALAAGASALGIGTDFGGSLRWPAQCVGVAALRPSAGTIPAQGQLPGAAGDLGHDPDAAPGGMQGWLQTIGPMARSVRDLSLAFDVLTGGSPDPSVTGPLRVAWSDGAHLGPVRGEVTALLADIAERLAAHGHTVTNVPRVFDCLAQYNRLRAVDPLRDHLAAITDVAGVITAANRDTIAASLRARPAETAAARREAERARSTALEVFDRADIVVLPVAGGPACDPGGRLEVDGRVLAGWELMGQCRAVSLTGAPAVSIPLGVSAEGLPLSVQIVAAPGFDRRALRAAAEIETCCAD
ncbi:amidase [Nocardia sp. NPDC004582]